MSAPTDHLARFYDYLQSEKRYSSHTLSAYRRDIEIGLRFWKWACIGPQVNTPDELTRTILDALETDLYGGLRARMVESVYTRIDGSARRAAATIAEYARQL